MHPDGDPPDEVFQVPTPSLTPLDSRAAWFFLSSGTLMCASSTFLDFADVATRSTYELLTWHHIFGGIGCVGLSKELSISLEISFSRITTSLWHIFQLEEDSVSLSNVRIITMIGREKECDVLLSRISNDIFEWRVLDTVSSSMATSPISLSVPSPQPSCSSPAPESTRPSTPPRSPPALPPTALPPPSHCLTRLRKKHPTSQHPLSVSKPAWKNYCKSFRVGKKITFSDTTPESVSGSS